MDHLQETLDEILVAIKDLVRCTELKGGKREITVPPVPDIVPYGNWDQANINGIWGTGSTRVKCSFLGFVKNFDRTGRKTTIYHEFTAWLFENPRNRNYWKTGNMVEVWDGSALTKSVEADFKIRHAGILSDFFKDFVEDRKWELLEEARRVMGSAGDGKMAKLERYLEKNEFTNPHADMALSNTLCKTSIKSIRYHLRAKNLAQQ